jgi:predicted secreted protein
MAKYAAKGALFQYESATGPSVYSTIPSVGDFELSAGEKEEHDVTGHDSANNQDESVLGISVREAFDTPITAWDGASTHHAALVTKHAADTPVVLKVTMKDTKIWAGTALIKNIRVSNPVRGALSAVVTWKPTGAWTIT